MEALLPRQCRASGVSRKSVGELACHDPCVGVDPKLDREETGQRRRLHFHLDDPGVPIEVVVRIERRVEAQARAQRKDDVGLACEAGRDGIASRSDLSCIERMRAWHGVAMTRRRRNRRVEQFGKPQYRIVRAAVLDPATGEDQWSLGRRQESDGRSNSVGIAAGRRTHPARRARFRVGELARLGEQVTRQVERHRSAPRRQRGAESLAHGLRDPRRLRDRPAPFGDRPEQCLLIDFLECIPVNMRGGERPGQHHHRRVRGKRLRQSRHRVGRPGSVLTGEEDPGAARCARIAVGHVRTGPLVAHADEPDARVLVERIEDLHAGRSDESEDVTHALGFQCSDDSAASCGFRQFLVLQ